MRPIDADELIQDIVKNKMAFIGTYDQIALHDTICEYAIDYIKKAKTIDAVPVVRCKDCQNYEVYGIKGYSCMSKGDNWYCADGERKVGEEGRNDEGA